MKKFVNSIPFFALLLLPLLFYPLVDTSVWQSSADVHAFFEFASSLLAMTAGVMVLLHYFTTGLWFFLIISIGFVQIGAEQLIHAAFSYNRIWSEIPPTFKFAISTTWLTGHFILLASFFGALIAGDRKSVPGKMMFNAVVYNFIGFICAAFIALLIFHAPFLPDFVQLGSFTKKLSELTLAFLYFAAFLFYLNIYLTEQSHSPLLLSIVVCIILRVIAHIFVFDSRTFYDAHWDTAHLIVLLSYFLPIFGVWGETIKLHKLAQKQVIDLEKEITERKRAEEALYNTSNFLENIADSSDAYIYVVDLDGRFLLVNRQLSTFFGIPQNELIGRTRKGNMPEATAEQHRKNDLEVIKSQQSSIFEENTLIDDIKRTYLSVKFPLKNVMGEIYAIGGISTDITERKQAEEKIKTSLREKETMLREIYHRVKNNMQVISSLLNMQSSYLQDENAKEALRNSVDRVKTMADIHNLLYHSDDMARIDISSLIRDLAGSLQQSYHIEGVSVDIHVDATDVPLILEQAVPCGLILNELVSNAMKHAFPEKRKGKINITMRSQDNHVVLTVQDNGIGFPESVDTAKSKSMGMELVNILVGQVGGKIDMHVDGGTRWTITFPVRSERVWRNG